MGKRKINNALRDCGQYPRHCISSSKMRMQSKHRMPALQKECERKNDVFWHTLMQWILRHAVRLPKVQITEETRTRGGKEGDATLNSTIGSSFSKWVELWQGKRAESKDRVTMNVFSIYAHSDNFCKRQASHSKSMTYEQSENVAGMSSSILTIFAHICARVWFANKQKAFCGPLPYAESILGLVRFKSHQRGEILSAARMGGSFGANRFCCFRQLLVTSS